VIRSVKSSCEACDWAAGGNARHLGAFEQHPQNWCLTFKNGRAIIRAQSIAVTVAVSIAGGNPNMAQESTAQVTLNDVAQYVGVSTSTVSRVLNNKGEISEDTRQRVFEAIHTLGYRPSLVAQGLRTKASRMIGLLLPEILSPLFAEFAMGVEVEASEAGYTVAHSNTLYSPEREKSGLNYLLDRYVDAVICYSPHFQEDELIPILNRVGAAIVVNRPLPDPRIGELFLDNLQGMQLVLTHLIELGYRKMAYFALSSSSWSGSEREKAFIQALHDMGLPLEPRMILNIDRDLGPDEQRAPAESLASIPGGAIEDGEWAASRFMQTYPDADAIIGFNDLSAIGITRVLVKAGKRIPEDIAVVGFDNSIMGSKFMPSITSAGVDNLDLGKQAARMLIDHLENHTPLTKTKLQFKLTARQSTLRGNS
jgi:LacI family transcriptional regulator